MAAAAPSPAGRLHVLVNNAARFLFGEVVDVTEAEWDAALGTNVKGCVSGQQSPCGERPPTLGAPLGFSAAGKAPAVAQSRLAEEKSACDHPEAVPLVPKAKKMHIPLAVHATAVAWHAVVQPPSGTLACPQPAAVRT